MEDINKPKKQRILEFNEIFEKEILPLYNDIEEQNRKDEVGSLRKYRVFVTGCFIVVILLGVCLIKFVGMDSGNIEIYNFSICAALMFSGTILFTALANDCFQFSVEKEFKTSIKESYLRKLLRVFGGITWWYSAGKISDNEIKKSGLFPTYSRREIDDEFLGVYKDVKFVISENKLYLDEWYGDKVLQMLALPVFHGCVITFDVNKSVKNRTIVASKNALTQKHSMLFYLTKVMGPFLALIPFLCLFVSLQKSVGLLIDAFILILFLIFCYVKAHLDVNEELNKMNLEDLKFNKMFVTYSSDDVEGRYLVTPAFMERIMKVQTAFGAKNIKCSFYDDKLMIAIDTKEDLFEIADLHTSLKDKMYVNKMYNQLASIYRLIEYFKLDEKTGL